MSLISCKIASDLIWNTNCIISSNAVDQATAFTITDTKLYVSVVTLSTQVNANLLQQLKSGFKRTTDWKKYQLNLSRWSKEIFRWFN